MKLVVATICVCLCASQCFAWSEGGHHLIAVMAFGELDQDARSAVLDILHEHPQREKFFTPPESIRDPENWLIGRAAFWPDLARKSAFDRPKWHYDVAIIGGDRQVFIDLERVSGHAAQTSPSENTLATREMTIAEALLLCRHIAADKSGDPADRAVALCWIFHLTGDAFQPCHTGSYYTAISLATGDRGGNEIPTKQGRKLHALWDSLLGPKFDEGDISRRAAEIRADRDTWLAAREFAVANRKPESWLSFSRGQVKHVYSAQIVEAIETADRMRAPIQKVDLPKHYLENAGHIARIQAAYASAALTEVLKEVLH